MSEKTTAHRKAEVWIQIKRIVDGQLRNLEQGNYLGEQAGEQVESEMIQCVLKQLSRLENTPQECSDPKDTEADCDLHETSPSVKAVDGEVMELPSVPVRLLIWQQIASTANSRMSSLEKRTSLGARSFLQHEKEAELKVEKTLSEQITQLLTVLTEERPTQ